jgi:formate dehydrogenase maturation protein FdhE
MKSFISFILLGSIIFGSSSYYGSTTAPVVLAGGIIKAKYNNEENKKYKRKDCPVCKGKGWYMSGDGIKKIDCSYCEPDVSNVGTKCITKVKKG